MQIHTNKYINDEQSIIMAIKIIKKAALKSKHNAQNNEIKSSYINSLYEIAGIYNCGNYDYQVAVKEIFDTIEKHYNNIIVDYNKIAKKRRKRKLNSKNKKKSFKVT